MITKTLKRMAVTSAFAGALGFAALGLGSGTAAADDDTSTPIDPAMITEYLPLITDNIGRFTEPGTIPDLGNLGAGDLAGLPVGDLPIGDLTTLLAVAGG